MKYYGLICGGIGDRTWDKEFEVEANSMLKAVEKISQNLPLDSDIVEIKQED